MYTAAIIRANHETLQRATSSIVRTAQLCIQELAGHFEQLNKK